MLIELVHALPGTSVAFVRGLFRALQLAHVVLQHVYILLCLHQRHVMSDRLSPSASRLLDALQQVEYFVDALDQATVVDARRTPAWSRGSGPRVVVARVRQVQSAYQLGETFRVVVRRTGELAAAVQGFLTPVSSSGSEVGESNNNDGEKPHLADVSDDDHGRASAGKKRTGISHPPVDAVAFAALDRKSGRAGQRPQSSDLS